MSNDLNLMDREGIEDVSLNSNYKTFDEYKNSGRKNNRKIIKENSFKYKIRKIIETTEPKELSYILDILFLMNHCDAHKDFLIKNMEIEPNYFNTYNNIKKAKGRAVSEMVYFCKDKLNICVNKNGKKDSRLWDVVVSASVGDLIITSCVSFKYVKNYIGDVETLEETDVTEDSVVLSNNKLGKQQFFTCSLRESFNKLDEKVSSFILNFNN